MMTKEGSTKIIFMTPVAGVFVLGCGHISHIVKMHYFFKNLLHYSHAYIRQTNLDRSKNGESHGNVNLVIREQVLNISNILYYREINIS